MTRAKELKARELEQVKELINKYETVSIADLRSLPSSTLQRLRNKLRDKIYVKVTKKSIISLAIDQIKNKDLTSLKQALDISIPVLILSNEDPFKLFKEIKANKSKAFAKPGQVSPMDIIVPAGPTNFTPGPIIGELGAVGLQTSVEQGKIAIKKEKFLVRENEIIKPEIASILSKLNITPIEIGLNIVSIYKDKIVYQREILDIDEKQYINNLILANSQAFALAEKIGYIDKENVKMLLSKVYITTLNVGKKLNLELNTEIKKLEKHDNVEKQEVVEHKHHEQDKRNVVGYTEDSVKKAQDILRDLQDKKIHEQEKPKFKSAWD